MSSITYTGQIKPGEYQNLPVSAGPFPEVGSLTFQAIQTYSNGEVVKWVDVTPPGGPEPDLPAPVLTLTPETDSAATTAATTDDDSDSSKTIAIVSLVVAGVALILAGVTLATRVRPRRRNRNRPTAPELPIGLRATVHDVVVTETGRVHVFERSPGDWWAECLVCDAWVCTSNATRRDAEHAFGRHWQNDHLAGPSPSA